MADCSAATAITVPYATTGVDNTAATDDSTSVPGQTFDHALWYRWTPSTSLIFVQWAVSFTGGTGVLAMHTYYGTCGGTLTLITDSVFTIGSSTGTTYRGGFQVFHPGVEHYTVLSSATGSGRTGIALDLYQPPFPDLATLPSDSGFAAFTVGGTGTIQVTKITQPTSSQSFDFTAGGGLSPSTFSLTNGVTQTFSGITAGTGYSITETPVAGYSTIYAVSNGSDPSNITVDPGETVTVTVTNAAAITYPLLRQRIFSLTPPFNQNLTAFIQAIEIFMQSGVGNSTSVSPTLTVSLSKDGGQTYTIERTLSIGAAGAYLTRVRSATPWGKARNPVLKICTSDPVFLGLLECYVDYDLGTY